VVVDGDVQILQQQGDDGLLYTNRILREEERESTASRNAHGLNGSQESRTVAVRDCHSRKPLTVHFMKFNGRHEETRTPDLYRVKVAL
jgi:hypothetical protein